MVLHGAHRLKVAVMPSFATEINHGTAERKELSTCYLCDCPIHFEMGKCVFGLIAALQNRFCDVECCLKNICNHIHNALCRRV